MPTVRKVSYNVEARRYDDDGQGGEMEIDLTTAEIEEFDKDLYRDIEAIPEGDWPYDIRVTNMDVGDPDPVGTLRDRVAAQPGGPEALKWAELKRDAMHTLYEEGLAWDNDDMKAAYEAGRSGMGDGLWNRWLKIRKHENEHGRVVR
jgi:hypothetical protein